MTYEHRSCPFADPGRFLQDGFRFPSQAFYEDLVTNRQLSSLDLQSYVQIIKAIFQETDAEPPVRSVLAPSTKARSP